MMTTGQGVVVVVVVTAVVLIIVGGGHKADNRDVGGVCTGTVTAWARRCDDVLLLNGMHSHGEHRKWEWPARTSINQYMCLACAQLLLLSHVALAAARTACRVTRALATAAARTAEPEHATCGRRPARDGGARVRPVPKLRVSIAHQCTVLVIAVLLLLNPQRQGTSHAADFLGAI